MDQQNKWLQTLVNSFAAENLEFKRRLANAEGEVLKSKEALEKLLEYFKSGCLDNIVRRDFPN